MSDPISDLHEGADLLFNKPSRWSYPETIHHPRCRRVTYRRVIGVLCLVCGLTWIVAGDFGLGCLWIVMGASRLEAA